MSLVLIKLVKRDQSERWPLKARGGLEVKTLPNGPIRIIGEHSNFAEENKQF
jgi:hypothetical protein